MIKEQVFEQLVDNASFRLLNSEIGNDQKECEFVCGLNRSFSSP